MFCVQDRATKQEQEEYLETANQRQQYPKKSLHNKIVVNSQHTQLYREDGHYQQNADSSRDFSYKIQKAQNLAEEIDAMRGVKTLQNGNKNNEIVHSQTQNAKSKSFVHNKREGYHSTQKNLNNSYLSNDEDLLVNKPHPREFYLKLMETEKKIQKGNFFQQDITLLIEMYTKCIEYFDSVQDPIKCYFEDKISSTLSSNSILSVLINSSKQQDSQQSQVQRSSTAKDNQCEQGKVKENVQQSQITHIPSLDKGSHRPRTLSEQKKHDRMKAQYNIEHIKLQKYTDIEKANFIKAQELQVQAKEQHKQNVISSQQKDINERLRLRKEKNLIQQSEKLINNIRLKNDSLTGEPSYNNGNKSARTLNTNSSQSSDLRITEEDLQQDDRSTRVASEHKHNKFAKSNSQTEIDENQVVSQNDNENNSSSSSSSDDSSSASSRSNSESLSEQIPEEQKQKEIEQQLQTQD
ncbi:hypothetical protein ABPG72_015237 [Tetrahymena utriculariae]